MMERMCKYTQSIKIEQTYQQGYQDQDWDALQAVCSAFCLLFGVYA